MFNNTNTKRVIRSGYRNFMRSGFTSLASVLIMTITLIVITSLLFVQVALQSSLNSIKEQVDVTVYFTQGSSEDDIKNIQTSIEKLPEVASILYISEDQALANFREKHAKDYLTLQALDELDGNPLGASLNIKAKDPSQYETIAKYFEQDTALAKQALTIIDKVDYHQNKLVIDRLTSIINGAKRLGFALSLLFVIISIIITFNTLRLIIYMSREEISVMRLVGAANRYIRGPFMVSGMLVGIFASVITIILFWPISAWLGSSQMTEFLGINLFDYYASNFFQLFFIMLVSGIIIGSISSVFAIRRYLNK
jgi:cell division transport system permease protein